MPIIFDSTVGGEAANSYASVAQADAYHDRHVYATPWQDATQGQKEIALAMATRELDKMMDWFGDTATATQSLAWPRYGLDDARGNLIPPDELPVRLVEATAEFARQLIGTDRTLDVEIGLASLRAGPVRLAFNARQRKVLPDTVVDIVSRWGTVRRRQSSVPLVRV